MQRGHSDGMIWRSAGRGATSLARAGLRSMLDTGAGRAAWSPAPPGAPGPSRAASMQPARSVAALARRAPSDQVQLAGAPGTAGTAGWMPLDAQDWWRRHQRRLTRRVSAADGTPWPAYYPPPPPHTLTLDRRSRQLLGRSAVRIHRLAGRQAGRQQAGSRQAAGQVGRLHRTPGAHPRRNSGGCHGRREAAQKLWQQVDLAAPLGIKGATTARAPEGIKLWTEYLLHKAKHPTWLILIQVGGEQPRQPLPLAPAARPSPPRPCMCPPPPPCAPADVGPAEVRSRWRGRSHAGGAPGSAAHPHKKRCADTRPPEHRRHADRCMQQHPASSIQHPHTNWHRYYPRLQLHWAPSNRALATPP